MQDSGHTPDWPGAGVERVMRNGKRIFTTAFKTWLVEQAARPGVSVAGLAMKHGVNANQLRRWMKQHLRGTSQVPALLPVTVCESPAVEAATPSCVPTLEIEVAGAIVRVSAAVDEQHLRRVLRALRS
ncbi:MAG: transposase [Methylibium sp.]